MRKVLGTATAIALAGCVGPPRQPPPPPAPRPAPPQPPASAPPSDWRDRALTPGTWHYAAGPIASASFGPGPAEPLLTLRCDRASRTVAIAREGIAGTVSGTLTIVTTEGSASRPAQMLADRPALAAAIPAGDPLLDRIAYSRGRILIVASGFAPLTVPAWAEIGRVIEDCRR